MTRQIIYIGIFRLPDRNAAALRVKGIGAALTAAGYDIKFIGDEKERGTGSSFRRLSRAIDDLVTASTYTERLCEVEWRKVRAVICYPGSATLVWRTLQKCRAHGVPLIIDSTEWYDTTHVPFGRFGPWALDSEVRMRWLHARARNVLCISRFLEEHYLALGCHVLRVPPLMELDDKGSVSTRSADGTLSLVYAGMPGRKDLIREIVVAVQAARQKGCQVRLHLVGISRGDICDILNSGHDRAADHGIICRGRVPHTEACRIVQSADFSVLLRPQSRFANAGFPTKFAESLSLGVPVIANITSDIGEYLTDGDNGFVVDEPSANALCRGIERAGALSVGERVAMRQRALVRAAACFGWHSYVDQLSAFIEGCRPCLA